MPSFCEIPSSLIKVKGYFLSFKKFLTISEDSKGFIAMVAPFGIFPFSTELESLAISSLHGAHHVAQNTAIVRGLDGKVITREVIFFSINS